MSQSQYRQNARATLSDAIIDAKIAKNLTFRQLTEGTGLSIAFVTAALFGQHPLPADAARVVADRLGLDSDAARALQTIPMRGSIPGGAPTDPTIYRFYEMVQVYGSTLKALVHEEFGDGIISAINFKLDIKKVDDSEGGHRAVITLDGKYLTKPFRAHEYLATKRELAARRLRYRVRPNAAREREAFRNALALSTMTSKRDPPSRPSHGSRGRLALSRAARRDES
ncbi:cyanate hydratase [Caballeronia cordobensis]|uniref:Cyanate hydratase n=1 Tax=Caballeronia cordobensis TaxID=1353886 RepID=A0A158I5T9_CABCO|nr:cyanate hydratase [Caballeronia cordobensis]